MKTEQAAKLINLSGELKDLANLPQNASRYASLMFLSDACNMMALGSKDGAERLVELVQVKGDRVIEVAMLKFLKILLEIQ